MAKKPNGEPFISSADMGPYHLAWWRWDDEDNWHILTNKTGGQRRFATADEAKREAKRIKMGQSQKREEPQPDPLGAQSWRAEKDKADEAELQRVFGTRKPRLVFSQSGKVEVEYKKIARA